MLREFSLFAGSRPPSMPAATIRLAVTSLEDRTTPSSVAGKWEGTLSQPGGPWTEYAIRFELTQTGDTIGGTERVSVTANPSYFVERRVSGTVANGVARVVDGAITAQNLPPGYYWLTKTTTFAVPASGQPTSVDGTWSAGSGVGSNGTVRLNFTPVVVADPTVAIRTVLWLALNKRAAGNEGKAAVQVDWTGKNLTGPVTVSVLASNRAGAAVLATATVDNTTAGSGTTVLYFAAAPAGSTPSALTVRATVGSKPSGVAVKTLAVAGTGALSFELQAAAPIARTRAERVQLWLEQHGAKIRSEAALRRIDPAAVAGAIAWEALVNVRSFSWRAVGPGKVHATEWSGTSAAQQVEELRYMPKQTSAGRTALLKTPAGAIEYIAAILGSFADAADTAGAESLRKSPSAISPERAAILATLYQGVAVERYLLENKPRTLWNRNKVDIRPANAVQFFAYKARVKTPYAANAEMGAWVQANIKYLTDAVDGKV